MGGVFWVFYVEYHVICEEREFDFFFANLNAFSFCCLIAEARTSTTMLNGSGETGHLCLIPDLREKAPSASPVRMIFAVGFS